jgi:hypothetical protein
MTVTMEDYQKLLGLSIRGGLVIGQAAPCGWRKRVDALLGRVLPEDLRGSHYMGGLQTTRCCPYSQ